MNGSVMDYERREVVDAIRAQRHRTVALLESLTPEEWDTIVTPGWRVREVAAHLIATDEAALTGRMLALGLRQVPIPEFEAWNDEQVRRWVDRPIPALLHALDAWGRRLVRIARMTPDAAARARIQTPLGRVSLRWLGMQRVYDDWVHCEDIRRALGLSSDAAPEVVRPSARQLQAIIPIQTLARIPATASGRVGLRFSDLDLGTFGLDLGARRYGIGMTVETTISGPAAAVIMVAAGRDRWRGAEERGDLVVAGPRPPAELFLDALLAV